MNTNKLLLSAALLAMAISSPTALAGPKERPFKASLAAMETLGFPTDCSEGSWARGTIEVFGKASHLGRVSGTGTDCIAGSTSSLPLPSPPPDPPYDFSDGMLTLVAANGDKLYFSYEGTFVPLIEGSPIFDITGTFVITGGTGRFANASGSGRMEGSENITTFLGQVELIGTISY